jgi:hypothetical protein
MKQLDLFNKSQPSDLELLDSMVTSKHVIDSSISLYHRVTDPFSQIDWDIQMASEAGDHSRVRELYTIKHDMR